MKFVYFGINMANVEFSGRVDFNNEKDEDDGYTKTTVTVHPGANFSYHSCVPTEEGYSSHSVEATWVSDRDGWEVEVFHGGRDCDGVLERSEEYFETVDGVQTDGEAEVYDQYAQAAGY